MKRVRVVVHDLADLLDGVPRSVHDVLARSRVGPQLGRFAAGTCRERLFPGTAAERDRRFAEKALPIDAGLGIRSHRGLSFDSDAGDLLARMKGVERQSRDVADPDPVE